MPELNILVVGNDSIERKNVKNALKHQPEYMLRFEKNAEKIHNLVETLSPKITIVKFSRLQKNEDHKLVETLHKIKPDIKIIALLDEPLHVLDAMETHAPGFITTGELTFLPTATAFVLEGQNYLSPTCLNVVMDLAKNGLDKFSVLYQANLTPKQKAILVAIKEEGARHKAAKKLGLVEPTVKSHIRTILQKLNAKRIKTVIENYGHLIA